MQSVPITTKVVSSNLVYGEVYSIQHYEINFSVTCDKSVVFSGYVSSTNKIEILLNVALNTINPLKPYIYLPTNFCGRMIILHLATQSFAVHRQSNFNIGVFLLVSFDQFSY